MLLTGGAPLYLRAEPVGPGAPAASRLGRDGRSGMASAVGTRPLWWPPGKVAARYLAPFLSAARPPDLAGEPLVDRVPPARTDDGGSGSAERHAEAVELALLVADQDAHFGDHRQALRALDAAAALTGGTLPRAYAVKRDRWRRLAAAR